MVKYAHFFCEFLYSEKMSLLCYFQVKGKIMKIMFSPVVQIKKN